MVATTVSDLELRCEASLFRAEAPAKPVAIIFRISPSALQILAIKARSCSKESLDKGLHVLRCKRTCILRCIDKCLVHALRNSAHVQVFNCACAAGVACRKWREISFNQCEQALLWILSPTRCGCLESNSSFWNLFDQPPGSISGFRVC